MAKEKVHCVKDIQPIINWVLAACMTSYSNYSKPLICGSIRREHKFVHDIDIVVVGKPEEVGRKYVNTQNDIQVDTYVASEENFGAMTLFLTGSKEFNVMMRVKAKARGMKLNQYGLWQDGALIASRTENDIFEALGMPYVHPRNR